MKLFWAISAMPNFDAAYQLLTEVLQNDLRWKFNWVLLIVLATGTLYSERLQKNEKVRLWKSCWSIVEQTYPRTKFFPFVCVSILNAVLFFTISLSLPCIVENGGKSVAYLIHGMGRYELGELIFSKVRSETDAKDGVCLASQYLRKTRIGTRPEDLRNSVVTVYGNGTKEVANFYANWALNCRLNKDLKTAEEYYQKAIPISQRLGIIGMSVKLLGWLGENQIDRGDILAAHATFWKATKLAENCSDSELTVGTLEQLGDLGENVGLHEQAEVLRQHSQSLQNKITTQWSLARISSFLPLLALLGLILVTKTVFCSFLSRISIMLRAFITSSKDWQTTINNIQKLITVELSRGNLLFAEVLSLQLLQLAEKGEI